MTWQSVLKGDGIGSRGSEIRMLKRKMYVHIWLLFVSSLHFPGWFISYRSVFYYDVLLISPTKSTEMTAEDCGITRSSTKIGQSYLS